MTRHRHGGGRLLPRLVGLWACAAWSCAHASLGGSPDSVQTDGLRMHGSIHTVVKSAYTLHEIQAANSRIIHEYTNPGGTVFAVTWRGQLRPDFQQLLGPYFGRFQEAVRQAHRLHRRGPLVIDQPGFVVQSGGHMRGFFGKAYLPDQLPPGVDPHSLQ